MPTQLTRTVSNTSRVLQLCSCLFIGGVHIMFCNLDELMTSLLCFLLYIIEQFRNTCDKKVTSFRRTIFIPCEKMSGKGDGSSASSVDLSRRDFRAMVYYGYYQGKSFQECFQSLKHCFGYQSPSEATIFRWCRQFMSGARTLEDDDRCGRMATTVTPEGVPRVESLIKKDPNMTNAEVQDIMKISSGSLTCIPYDSLGVRRRCTRWVPNNLSEEQKQDRVDLTEECLLAFGTS